MEPQLLSYLAIVLTIVGAVWGHAIWLSNQFKSIYKAVDLKFEKLMDTLTKKLEHHERHDDVRFSEMSESLWEIRLHNAITSGKLRVPEVDHAPSKKE